LSNQLSNRFDNRLYRVYKHSTGFQTRLTTGLTTGSCIQPVVKSVVQRDLTTGCSFNTVVKLDNRLYLVNGVLASVVSEHSGSLQ